MLKNKFHKHHVFYNLKFKLSKFIFLFLGDSHTKRIKYFKINIKFTKYSNAFTLFELMIAIAIISILSSIAIPNLLAYRNIAYCNEAETDASNVGMAISNYYSVPYRISLPHITDLDVNVKNPVEIVGHPENIIEIKVTDFTGRCPDSYQEAQENWNSNVFSKFVR